MKFLFVIGELLPLYNIGRVVKPNCDVYHVGIEQENGDVIYSSAGWGGYHHF
jgi:hypothetical protein